ncbi:hypothetical protein KO317_03055 [Candidatus Micrarchaeota archaeon]|nr:hypothetical protein [Candidatus Micrarchaeota archaeon]
MKKGQSAIETITILGFIILFSIPLLFLLTSLNKEEAVILQARSSVKQLADTANSVYIQGKDASQIISVAMPQKLKEIRFESLPNQESEIVFILDLEPGEVDIVAISIAPIDITSNITGSAGLNQGIQKVKIEYDGNVIKFIAIK